MSNVHSINLFIRKISIILTDSFNELPSNKSTPKLKLYDTDKFMDLIDDRSFSHDFGYFLWWKTMAACSADFFP